MVRAPTSSLDFQLVRAFKVVSSYNIGLDAENPQAEGHSSGLLSQKWQDQWDHIARYNLVALRRRMNVVPLHHSSNAINVLQQEGQHGHMVLLCKQRVRVVELANIVGTIIRRQRDTGARNFNARLLKRPEDLVEIRASVLDRQTAQPVVAAKLDNDDRRMKRKNLRQPLHPILSSVSANALVIDAVVEGQRVQIGLQVVGVALARIRAGASGQAIAETHQHRASIIARLVTPRRRGNWLVRSVSSLRSRRRDRTRHNRARTGLRSCIRRWARAASR